MSNREGQRVRIEGGMRQFVGKIGRIVAREGRMYRVRLVEAGRRAGRGHGYR